MQFRATQLERASLFKFNNWKKFVRPLVILLVKTV